MWREVDGDWPMERAGADAPVDSASLLPPATWTTLRVAHNPLDGASAAHTPHRPDEEASITR